MVTLRLRLDPFVERSVKTRHALEPPWSSAVSVRYNTPCTPKGTGWTAVSTSQWTNPLLEYSGLSSRTGGFIHAQSTDTHNFSFPQISEKA